MEQILQLILVIILGTIFGSYATLFAYRLPLGESCFGRYFGKKSRCPSCETIIRTRELIPLLNWLFTFGKCKSCKVKIPKTHLFVELATTTLFILCFFTFAISENFIIYSLICTGLVILLTTDYTHKVFPNNILYFIITLGLINRAMEEQTIINIIYSGAVGVIFASVFYQIFYKKTNGFFASKHQSLEYTKFILVASLLLQPVLFLIYFIAVMAIFTVLVASGIDSRKKHYNYGYCLIVPFLWLTFLPPTF